MEQNDHHLEIDETSGGRRRLQFLARDPRSRKNVSADTTPWKEHPLLRPFFREPSAVVKTHLSSDIVKGIMR